MPPGVATWRAILQSFGGNMALTIRKLNDIQRSCLDQFKRIYGIKTDSKGLLMGIVVWDEQNRKNMEILDKLKQETKRADDAERILETLRDTMKKALTTLDQKEMKL